MVTTHVSQNIRCEGGDSNTAPPEYEAKVAIIQSLLVYTAHYKYSEVSELNCDKIYSYTTEAFHGFPQCSKNQG